MSDVPQGKSWTLTKSRDMKRCPDEGPTPCGRSRQVNLDVDCADCAMSSTRRRLKAGLSSRLSTTSAACGVPCDPTTCALHPEAGTLTGIARTVDKRIDVRSTREDDEVGTRLLRRCWRASPGHPFQDANWDRR